MQWALSKLELLRISWNNTHNHEFLFEHVRNSFGEVSECLIYLCHGPFYMCETVVNMIINILENCVLMIIHCTDVTCQCRHYSLYSFSGKASTKTVKHLKKIPEGSRQHDMMKVRDLPIIEYLFNTKCVMCNCSMQQQH